MNPFIRMLLDQFARGWLERKGPPAFRGPTPERRKRGNKIPYGRGLQNHFNRKRRDRADALIYLREATGDAYTLVGNGFNTAVSLGRRKWLAGISAQRGY